MNEPTPSAQNFPSATQLPVSEPLDQKPPDQKPPDQNQGAQSRGCSPIAWFRRQAFFRWFAERFEKIIVITLTLVTVMAALIAFLQSWADGTAVRYARQSQVLSIEAMGHDMSSRQRESHDFDLYVAWNEWDYRRLRAVNIGRDRDNTQAEAVTEMIIPMTPLLAEDAPYFDPEIGYANVELYHADTNLITTTILMEQRAFITTVANHWNNKGDGFVTVLTVLAVALFLFGLSTTIGGAVRYLFAMAGTFLVGACVLWTLVLVVAPAPAIPYAAIDAYAHGEGLLYAAASAEDYQAAAAAFDKALSLYPDYGNALAARASLAVDLNDYETGIKFYRQASESGRSGADIAWELGWALYLVGDYDAALEVNREALENDPDMLPLVLNIGLTLLAQGQTEAAMQEYERGLTLAGDPDTIVSTSWNLLYLREAVNDLDRLVAALDGRRGFAQEPDLRNVADRAQVRAAAEQARQRINEGIVSIETGGGVTSPTDAVLSAPVFARYTGHDDVLLGAADFFPRGLATLVIQIAFEDLPTGAVVSRRITRQELDEPGWREYLPTLRLDTTWEGDSDGQLTQEILSPWPGRRGFQSGLYTVDYYSNGRLVQSGQFTIPAPKKLIVSTPIFATSLSSAEEPDIPDNLFPAGINELHGQFMYSGIALDSVMVGKWYRDGELYERIESDPLSTWGIYSFFLRQPPAGHYRLDLYLKEEDAPIQTAEVTVMEIQDYLNSVAIPSDNESFYRNLGDGYLFKKEYQNAAEQYERAVALEPECGACFYGWGRALHGLGDKAGAEEKLLVAIEQSPLEYLYPCTLGDFYYQWGEEEKALGQYRAAALLDPAMVFNRWGNSLYDLERYEEASWKYQQALDFDPTNPSYYSNLGGTYLEIQEYAKAEAAFDQALALDEDNDWYYNRWGDVLYAQGKYDEALEKYTRAAELDPEYAPYFSDLGNTYYDMEEYDKASNAAQRALELISTRDEDYLLWGNSLYKLERYQEAADKYQQAIALEPDSALYYANLGWACYHIPDTDRAIAAFEKTAELAERDGNQELQEEAETMLEELR